MSYSIDWEPTAVAAASRYLDDDADALRALVVAIDHLADDPRPSHSFPFGSLDMRRLRLGRYRALYQITDATRGILITHIGRSG